MKKVLSNNFIYFSNHSILFITFFTGFNYDILSFTVIGTAVVTMDLPHSRISTDISLCGRILTVTTNKEITIFPLPVFFSDFIAQGEIKILQSLKEFDEEIENNITEITDLKNKNKTEFFILQPMKLIFREKDKNREKDKLMENQNKKNQLSGNFGEFQGSVVISTKITKNLLHPEALQKNSNSLKSKKNSNINVNSKSKNNLIKISNNLNDGNGNGEGDEGERENDQLLITLQIAVFNLRYSYWMLVEGNFLGNLIKNKNENIKINANLHKKNVNLENTDMDFTVLDSIEMKKEFDVIVLKCWKLPSSVSIFSFLEDRSMVAIGLNNGKLFISIKNKLSFYFVSDYFIN